MLSPAADPPKRSVIHPSWFLRLSFPFVSSVSTHKRSDPDPDPDSDSHFLNLPPELRLKIYCHIVRNSEIWVDPEPTETRLWPWQSRRRPKNFRSSGQWSILLTCKLCFQEARRLFIQSTKFSVTRRHRWEHGIELIRFAETLSEYSRLHLFEIRDFLAGWLQTESVASAWVELCVQAIPLFTRIRTCVLHQDLWGHWENHMDYLPGGYMTEEEVKGMVCWSKKKDRRVAKFVALVLSDEYRYMGHIDFLFVFYLCRCTRRFVGPYAFREQVHKHTIEAVSFVNLGQRTGFLDRDRDLNEEDGLDRVRRSDSGAAPQDMLWIAQEHKEDLNSVDRSLLGLQRPVPA